MTPEQIKAEELVKVFSPKLPWYSKKDNKTKSIECAIICVDEIIKEICKLSENINPKYQDEKIEFWQTVKQHLEEMK